MKCLNLESIINKIHFFSCLQLYTFKPKKSGLSFITQNQLSFFEFLFIILRQSYLESRNRLTCVFVCPAGI